MPERHALYPGSFDVLTFGHIDVIRRAARFFPKITVGVAINREKRPPLFTPEERIQMIHEATADVPNVDAQSFVGLTVEFARKIGATVIVRGLRAVSDFEYELQMAQMNDNLAPEITTIFLAPSPQFVFLSSTVIKEIAAYGADISELVPPNVEAMVKARLGNTK